jgi:trans-aconitate methyltransferase
MTADDRKSHWERVYATKTETEVSWYQADPAPSLETLARAGADRRSAVIDVGGGTSSLVDRLIHGGYEDVTVLDVSAAALAAARARLGEAGRKVHWLVADATEWAPERRYDVWHDRAAFHFLVDPEDRAAYVERLREALPPGGRAIIATFAPDGPERCSGLPIMRYDGPSLAAALGPNFVLLESRRHDHLTPSGAVQRFQFSVFRRV